MNIFNITAEQQRINEMLEETGGELTPEIEDALLINEENFLAKVENYAYSILKYKDTAESIDREVKRLQSLKKTAENTAERLRERVSDALIIFDRPKLDLGNFKLSFRKSETVKIDEGVKLPEKYEKVKIDYDKVLLKNDLKAGIEIAGVSIVENQNLQIK